MDEEQKFEQESVKIPTAEEIRAHVIAEYGFDETAEAERIDKAIAKEIKNRTILSSAIGAKVKIRGDFEELKKKVPQTKDEAKKDGELSSLDVYTLVEAKVPREDIQEVSEYAKLKNIPISEALNSSVVKAILADKAEKRATANATQTTTTRQTVNKKDGNSIIDEARTKGESGIPEAGSQEAEAMFLARRGRKEFPGR